MLIRNSILVILLSAVTAFPQGAASPRIQTEDDLVSVLASLRDDDASTASAILRDHRELLTRSLIEKLFSQANQVSKFGAAQRSLTLYELAREAAVQAGEKRLAANSLYNVGRLHFRQGNIGLAKREYLQSKQEFEAARSRAELVVVLGGLGNVCLYMGDSKEARDYSSQSIAIANSLGDGDKPLTGPVQYGVAVAWSNLGDLAKADGKYDEALAYFQKALESFKALSANSPEYSADVVDSLAEIGRVYRVMGDHQHALNYFNQALTIAKTTNSNSKLASVLNSIGVLYIEQSDYEKASDYINQSLTIYRNLGNRLEIARLLINQGVINQRQGSYEEALKSFQASLKSAEGSNAPDLVLTAQEGMGAVYQEQGDYRAALEWLDRALSMAQQVGDKTRCAELLWREGEAYYLKGDVSQALKAASSAADLAGQLRLPVISYLALTSQGKYYLAESNYELARQTLSQAIEQIEGMRAQVAGQAQERQIFFENKITPYNLLVELLVKQNKLADALIVAERAKGRVLLDVLRDGKIDLASALTPAEKEEATRLNRNISGLNERVRIEQANTRPDVTALNQLFNQLDSARLKYESYQNALFASHPEFNVRRGRIAPLTWGNVNELARDGNTAYFEYVVTKEQIILFVLTKKDENAGPELRAYPIAIKPRELERKVDQFRQAMADRNPVFANSAHELYDLLIKPAAQQLSGVGTLCLIPDEYLWDLPFQALLSTNDMYLLEDYALYYTPSLSVQRGTRRLQNEGAGRATQSLIAFGNPVIGKERASNTQTEASDLCPLPEAEAEVTSLAQIYGQTQSKAFTGREATEKTFKTLAPRYRTIHLATHGILDNRHPLYSYLLLTKTEGEPENDGLLEAREIMDMNINADLAVLSACDTARGRVGAGEGVIGMSWAFFVAGVRTTVVSQWKVNSASTSQLMVNFYQALKPDQKVGTTNKAEALRKAAISLMKDGRYRHPFYWAGFVMVGSNR